MILQGRFSNYNYRSPALAVKRMTALDIDDYLLLIKQLSTTGFKNREAAVAAYQMANRMPNAITFVGHHRRKLVACGSLFLLHKVCHEGRPAGIIEDVVVHKPKRGNGFGKHIVNHLLDVAKELNCYRVSLSCSDHNANWYNKFGFYHWQNAQRIDLPQKES